VRLFVGSDFSNGGLAFFDLSTGAVSGVASSGTGTNVRAFSVSMGQGGWWRCYVIARCAASATIASQYNIVSGASTVTYTGDGTSSIGCWRLGSARSSFPVTPAQTSASAVAVGTAQRGTKLYVKGLPVSTVGLLKRNDEVEIITSFGSEMKILTASLDSDSAGRGLLYFSPPLRGDVADNAAIIVNNPMFYGFMPEPQSWQHDPGIMTSASAEFEEV
jgi:hypothetical protein